MMKFYRIAVVGIFVVMTAVFGYTYIINYMSTDTTYPIIHLEDDVLEISVNADASEFLDGVTARDGKDGDISDKVIVESVSKFIKPGICKVTYAVCDADNHVATAVRKVKYTDYKSPQYVLNESLCYSVYEAINFKDAISVSDCFDGDLSNSMILTSNDYTGSAEGVFTIDATVTSSRGDTVDISFPFIVENRSLTAPQIELSQYLLYTKKGKTVDPEQFIVSATDNKDEDITEDITIDTNLDVNKKGTYLIHYYAVAERGERGHSVLIVVVGNCK